MGQEASPPLHRLWRYGMIVALLIPTQRRPMTTITRACRDCGQVFRRSRADTTVRCPECRHRKTAKAAHYNAVACGRCGHVHITLRCDRCGY